MSKILIVDDEKDILESMKKLLENDGYEAKIAISGQIASEMLQKEKFDLVLLDILMPKMSGREVLENIRNNSALKNQKVAFLTVVRLSRLGEKITQELKPIEYFQKPIDVPDFRKRLKKII